MTIGEIPGHQHIEVESPHVLEDAPQTSLSRYSDGFPWTGDWGRIPQVSVIVPRQMQEPQESDLICRHSYIVTAALCV
jgi:hypothetical protein